MLDVLLEADQAESGRCRRRFGRGVSGPKPVWRGSSSGKAKSRILTQADEHDLRACGVGVVGLAALVVVVESGLECSVKGFAGGAVVTGVEFGRERVEEHRESAPEVRREATGEGGAGREEVSELREDLRPSSGDDLAGSVGAGEEVDGGEDGRIMVVGVFWLLARGVLGERGTTCSTPFEFTLGGTVVALGSCVGGTRGSTPLLRQVTSGTESASLSLLSSAAAGFLSCDSVVAVTGGAEGLLAILFPAFILESVDLRLVVDDITAYSCGERIGGGKKGEPGEGKGDEEMDNLLTVTVSEGVVSGRQSEWQIERRVDCATDLLCRD